MKRSLLSVSVLLAGTTGVFAGNAGPAPSEPVVSQAAPAPVAPAGGDWTGGFVGLSFGTLSLDADGADDSEAVYGLHGGYDYDFGQFVLGGELDFQTGEDIALGATDVDDILRAKLRGGYDLGRTLVYGTLGAAQLNADSGDDTGFVGGLGVEYRLTEQFTVGGEYLAHRFNDFDDSDVDIDADTLSIRGNFRF